VSGYQVERARLVLVCSVVLALGSSCRTNSDQSTAGPQPTEETISSTPPFRTREPPRYQAVRTITVSSPTGDLITSRVVARDGDMRREESDEVGGGKVVYLEIPSGRFLLLTRARLFADLSKEQAGGPESGVAEADLLESSPDRLLHTEPSEVRYQKLGSEILNGRSTSKYRVVVNTAAPGAVNASVTLIWIDDDLGMPIKSETTSGGGKRTTSELSTVSLEVDRRLFQIPLDYEKVTADVIRNHLNRLE
jgi:hypothetical protein